MRIGINASFARKPNTGIGQVTFNFLRKLNEVLEMSDLPARNASSARNIASATDWHIEAGGSRPKQPKEIGPLEIFLYLEEDIDLKLPENFTKKIFLPLWRRDDLIRKIWWEKFLLPRKVKQDKCDVFISLYQCPTIIKFSPFGKGRIKEGFEKRNSAENSQIPPNPHFLKGEIKHLMIVHDIIPKLFPEYLNNSRKKLYWRQTEKAVKKADKIIAISRRTEKDLVQHLGIAPERITVNYIDAGDIYKKDVETSQGASVLKKYNLNSGYIYSGGGLEIRKNIEGVIRAYKVLCDRNKREKFIHEFPRLVISGKLMPELKPLITDAENLIKELNLAQNVKLLDFVPQEDLPAIYKNALMFVYPSKYEGFGLPVLEAMNQGRPVITAKTSSLPEVGGDSVLYCDPEDVHDLAMVMKNVIMNKELRETLSRRAKIRAKNFSWNKFTEKVLHIISNF